jgi:hypothetical protein
LLRKLSQLTHAPEKPPTPDQELAADKTTWDAAYALAEAGLLIAGRPDLVEERKNTRDETIGVLRMFLLGPVAANFDIGTLDWVASKVIDLGTAGLGTGTPSFDARVRLSNTASLLARLELERRATVLFALLTAKKSGIIVSDSTDLVNADAELDRISQETHAGIIETKAIDSLDLAAIQKNNIKFDAASKSCELDKIDLVGRQVSLADGRFVESFTLTCRDARQFSYQFVDQIPAGYAAGWKRHPRLFDFMHLSITALMADADGWRTRTPDIDLVRGVPQLSVPALLVALRKPDVPWQYLREYMLLDYKPGFGWLAHFDPPPILNQIVVGQTNVAASDEAYNSAHDWLIGRMTTFLTFVAKKSVVNVLMPIALKMDDYIRDCPAPWGPFLGDAFCNKRPNYTKRQLVADLNSLDAEAKAANVALQNSLFGIDTAKCKSGARPGTTRIGVLFNPTLTKYLVRYQWDDVSTSQVCDFGDERQLDLSQEVAEGLKQAFSQDASALVKFNLDIAVTGTDEGYRTAVAIGRAARLKEDYATAEQLLHSAGLYPLYKNFLDFHPNDTDYFYTSYVGLVNAVKWPILREHLLNSDDGLLYDAEFGVFDCVFQRFQPPDLRFVDQSSTQGVPMIQPTELDPRFLKSVVALNEELVNKALKAAQDQIDATIGKLKAQENSWSVGISIGTSGFNAFGALQFSFNGKGAGIGFSMPDLAITYIAPGWDGARIPISISHGKGTVNGAIFAPHVSDMFTSLAPQPPVLPGTSVAIPWTAAPQVEWATDERDTSSPANRQLFVGLLGRAVPAMTDADVQKVLDGLKLPVFPEKLAKFLFSKSYEGFEMQKIADGSWYPTFMNLQLLPTKSSSQPCPISGCIDPNNQQELAKYIADFNKSESNRFDEEVTAAQAATVDKHAFASDIPAVRLTYGPGFKVMMTEYSWPAKKDGHLITMRALQETPVFVIDKIRASPTGHEFEKWAVAITDGFAIPVDVSEPTLKKAKAPYVEEIGNQLKAVQGVTTDPAFQSFSKQLEQAWKNFWSGWKAHGEKEIGAGSKDAFIEPFAPEPLSTPMLRFFDPPWQHAFVNGMTMEDWLIYERSTDFYKRIGRGGFPN